MNALIKLITGNWESFIQFVPKNFRKTNITKLTCAYQEVSNINFLESFAYVLNE